MNPGSISIADFYYDLPQHRIAKFSLPERDQSKLVVYKNGCIEPDIYRNIAGHIPGESLLVLNDTRVVEARLLFRKPTGAVIEIFCLEPAEEYPDITSAMLTTEKVRWKCLIGGAGKWKHGMILTKEFFVNEQTGELSAAIVARHDQTFIIEFSWLPPLSSFAEVLHVAGLVPLPPYLHRPAEEFDKERYQTIYASHDGSVAAPTAGLHFTDAIFKDLEQRGISKEYVTLHVGAGTFKPVKSKMLANHEMHAEFIEVTTITIEEIISHLQNTIVAVGTTSLRTLESLYWMGIKLNLAPAHETHTWQSPDLSVNQWEPYEIKSHVPAKDALHVLLNWMNAKGLKKLITKTRIIIAPGYKLRVADALITNFHQPGSTLLLLIAAVIGNDWKKVYSYALENDYRFLSYGDGCLLFANK